MVSVRQVNIAILMPDEGDSVITIKDLVGLMLCKPRWSFRIESPRAQEMPEKPILKEIPQEAEQHEQ